MDYLFEFLRGFSFFCRETNRPTNVQTKVKDDDNLNVPLNGSVMINLNKKNRKKGGGSLSDTDDPPRFLFFKKQEENRGIPLVCPVLRFVSAAQFRPL